MEDSLRQKVLRALQTKKKLSSALFAITYCGHAEHEGSCECVTSGAKGFNLIFKDPIEYVQEVG